MLGHLVAHFFLVTFWKQYVFFFLKKKMQYITERAAHSTAWRILSEVNQTWP